MTLDLAAIRARYALLMDELVADEASSDAGLSEWGVLRDVLQDIPRLLEALEAATARHDVERSVPQPSEVAQ